MSETNLVLKKEKGYVKFAWILPFVFGLLIVVAGVAGLTMGYTAENSPLPKSTPQSALNMVNSIYLGYALILVFLGVSFALVSATGFRKAQKWSWLFFLVWFGFLMIDEIVYSLTDPIGLIGLVLTALGLLLPFRKFFPKRENVLK